MAKGQQKSNREAKKPKKTDADRLKDKTPAASLQASISGETTRNKK
jgi:hypothetical protein